jgi:hypothetical protein
MATKTQNEFDNFIDAVADELLAMPDDQVLKGIDPALVLAEGERLLQAAKAQARSARKALEAGADIADE